MTSHIPETNSHRQALQVPFQFFQAALDALSPHIAVLDTSGTIIAVNAAWRQFAKANQLNIPFYGVGLNYLEICETVQGQGQAEALAVARGIREIIARQHESFELEYPCHTPEEQRWFMVRASLIQDGQNGGVMVVHENITGYKVAIFDRAVSEKQQAEQAIRESEERFRSLVEGSIQGILVHRNTRPLFANQAYARIMGYDSPDEILSVDSVVTLIAPHDRERLLDYHSARIKGEVAPSLYEYDAIRKDGSIVTLQLAVTMIPWDGAPAVLATALDVTERKQAEVQLCESERFIQRIASATPHIIYVFDINERRITYSNWSNQRMTDLLGYTFQEIQALGSDFLPKLLHPDDLAWLGMHLRRWDTATDEDVFETEYRLKCADGSWRWFLGSDTVFTRTPDGRVKEIIGVNQDVTEYKRAEEALRQSERYYRMLTESLTDYVIHLDSEGRIQFVNRLAEGYTMEMVRGRSVLDFLTSEFHETTLQALKTVLETGQPTMFENFGQRTATTQGWYFTRLVPISDDNSITSVLLIATDITERKQTELDLKESEKRFRMMADSAPVLIWLSGSDTLCTFFNKPWLDFTGRTLEQEMGIGWAEGVHPDNYNRCLEIYLSAFEARQEFEMEYRLRRADGQYRWIVDRGIPRYEGDTFVGYIGSAIDITERKQAEEELRRSESRLRQAQRLAGLGVAEWDIVTDKHTWSEEMCVIFGLTPPEFTGKTQDVIRFIHPDDRRAQQVRLQNTLEKAKKFYAETGQTSYIEPDPQEFRLVRPDGTIRHIRGDRFIMMDDNGQPLRMLASLLDITAEKEREEALQFQKTLLECQGEASPDGILVVSNERQWLSFNRRFVEMWDIPDYVVASRSREKALPLSLNKVINPDEFTAKITYLYEYSDEESHDEIALKDGRVFDRFSAPVKSEDGTHYGRVWYYRDITERKQAEKARRESEERFRTLIEGSLQGILVYRQAKALFANRAYANILGYESPDEILSMETLVPLLAPYEQERLLSYHAARLRGEAIPSQYECDMVRKDGSIITVEQIINIITWDGEPTALSTVIDITERKQLEEQLRQSQKMEAIGRLAGGVAHDFNNLLTVIIGYTEFLSSTYLNSADPRLGEVEQIRRAGERAALLTRQLLAFSRQQPLQPQLLNFSQIVANMEEMLRRLIGEDITLITRLALETDYVRADPGQIEQIIMNLVVNARDAMPQGGRLTIETTNLELDKLEAGIYGVKPGPQVGLLVSDTGLGMNAEIKSRIFEPFFTTKGTGKGTGLGLAMVYGIIEQSGGHIRVESAPGQGATFKIYLPQVEPPTKPPLPSTSVSSSSMENDKTILLVEDEAAVRLITKKFLQKRGYKVLEAGHAREALDLCQQHQGQIDLLITDVVMPEINGPELAGQLAQLYPSLKVLYISGYSDDILDQYEIASSNLNLLEKPFSSEGLILKVRNLLSQVDDNPP